MESPIPDCPVSTVPVEACPPAVDRQMTYTVTPSLPPMARFPTNDVVIDVQLEASIHPAHEGVAYTASPASLTPSDASYHTSSTTGPDRMPPTAIAVNFTPSYTINNPYVRPYIETLVYPAESFDGFPGVAPRARPDPESRARWLQPELNNSEACCGDVEERHRNPAYDRVDMSQLYTSRLLSPTMQTYEESRLLSPSPSRSLDAADAL